MAGRNTQSRKTAARKDRQKAERKAKKAAAKSAAPPRRELSFQQLGFLVSSNRQGVFEMKPLPVWPGFFLLMALWAALMVGVYFVVKDLGVQP